MICNKRRAIVGMETSGQTRRALQAKGWWVLSVDILPADDIPNGIGPNGGHFQGDVFQVIALCAARGFYFDLGIFHPSCTYLTSAAEWAYKDPDFIRYPGVGYHQRLKPGTLFGAARREARERAIEDVKRLWSLPIEHIAIENPVGVLSTRWRTPDQIIHPYHFGDNASKATCLWLKNLPRLPIETARKNWGRTIVQNGKLVLRWANQTDRGQNRLTPANDRWKERSKTFDGVCDAFAKSWSVM